MLGVNDAEPDARAARILGGSADTHSVRVSQCDSTGAEVEDTEAGARAGSVGGVGVEGDGDGGEGASDAPVLLDVATFERLVCGRSA